MIERSTIRVVFVLIVAIAGTTVAVVTPVMRERMFFNLLESINIDSILVNQRLIDKYIKCLLKTGICDPIMKDFRISLPLILEHLCETRCSERERRNLRKMFEFVRSNRSQEWDRLAKLYDPKGRYKQRMDAFIRRKSVLPQLTVESVPTGSLQNQSTKTRNSSKLSI